MDIIIPNDIIIQILVRLPAKYVFKLRCVCKYWFNLTSDPVFIKMHLHHHQHVDQTNHSILVFDYTPYDHQTVLHSLNYKNNSIDIDDAAAKWVSTRSSINWELFPSKLHNYMPLGSCNGLLCILTSKSIRSLGDRIHLLNPCTKQYKELPQLYHERVVLPTYEFAYSTYGFGYDRINDDYKVVKNFSQNHIIEDKYQCRTIVDVYTLGTNSWRRIEDVLPYELKDVEGVLVGGVLYWRAEKSLDHYMIVGFELGDEVHKEIFPPSPSWCGPCQQILELKGCLSIFEHTMHDTIEVWSLMNKDNSDDWVYLFTIADPKLVMPFLYRHSILLGVCNEDGELLMKSDYKQLVWYNPRDGKTRFFAKIPKEVDCRSYRVVVRYSESLVSLHLGGKQGKII